MSQRALALRFLTRTQAEVAQIRACLPDEPLAIEQAEVAHIERLAQKISSGAEVFGLPELDAIAGAIELISQERVGRTVRERLALAARLSERISALSVYVEYELADNEAKRVPEELPMS